MSPRAADAWRAYGWQLVRAPALAPLMHMALDETLLNALIAGERPPMLRVWEWAGPAVVLGRFQSVRNEVDPDGAARYGVDVVRRITGGGAMFIEPGNTITYSVYAPAELVAGMSAVESYAFMDQWVLDALATLGVQATYQPINDITSPGGKIGGAAQIRRGGAVLHHVTMAYDIDATKMLQVLRIGREKLSDKGTASAAKRVDPLRSQTQQSRSAIVERFIATFRDHYGLADTDASDDELAAAAALVESKYATEAWAKILP